MSVPFLANFEPKDEREAAVLDRLRHFWEENGLLALGSEIAAEVGHITAQAHIENREGDKVLLVFSSKEGRWKYPGAHIDANPRRTATEEATRALGRDAGTPDEAVYSLSERVIPEYWSTPQHTHFEVTFRFVANETQDLPRGARWFELSDAQEHLQQ